MRAGEIAKAQNEERKGGETDLRDFFAKQKKAQSFSPKSQVPPNEILPFMRSIFADGREVCKNSEKDKGVKGSGGLGGGIGEKEFLRRAIILKEANYKANKMQRNFFCFVLSVTN